MAGDDDGDDGIDFSDSFGPHGWPIWTILMLMSFWGLAAVCEDFFVPALNVLCISWNIPDDVAGATFMAAGASSPELFSAIISLFVTKSALGIGTIIGSEIFNHLCICAGSIFYSKSGTLVLDFRVLSREVSFYGLAIIALLYCESDTHECSDEEIENDKCYKEWDDEVGTDLRIYLQWYKPLILLCCYFLYVLVCGNYLYLIDIFCPRSTMLLEDKDIDDVNTSFHGVTPSFVEDYNTSRSTVHFEPSANFAEHTLNEQEGTGSSNSIGPYSGVSGEGSYGDIKALPLFDNKLRRNSFDGSTPTPRDGTQSLDGRRGTAPPATSSSGLPTFTPVRNTIDLGIENESMANGDRSLRYSTGSTANNQQSMDARHISQGKIREHELRKALQGPAIFSVRSQLLQGALGVSSVVAPNASMMLSADLHAVESSATSFGCFLWKHSRFYSRIRMSSRAWQLKWITIDGRGFRSCRNRDDPDHNVRPFNIYNATDVCILDPLRMTFILKIPNQGDLTFQAPSQLILEQVLSHLKSSIIAYRRMAEGQRDELYKEAILYSKEIAEAARDSDGNIDLAQSLINRNSHEDNLDDEDEDEEFESLIEWPHGAGYFSLFLHCVLLPLKVCLHYSIPDVRHMKSRDKYMTAIAMCFFWLITLSFIMTISVEALATVLNISDAVAGLTISAAGTSFPNLVASMIVARQGLGNMAVSNAFGSNVFNVFMGLGIPWFFYCFFAPQNVEINTKYHSYHGLAAEGVLIPTVFLLAALLIFVLLLAISGMKLYTWHAYLFMSTYLLFLVWAVGWQCNVPPSWPQTF